MKKKSKRSLYLIESKKAGFFVDKVGILYDEHGIKQKVNVYNKYIGFTFKIDGKFNVVHIHQLQAFQKFGDLIFETEVVRHLNGNSLDNKWENIEIGSKQDNSLDIPKEIRIESAKNASSYIHRFSEQEVLNIWKDRQSGSTYKELCEKYNTSKSTLSHFFNKAEYVKEILKNNIL